MDRAEFDIEANSDAVEFIAISTSTRHFDGAYVQLLLDTWCDSARIKRTLAEERAHSAAAPIDYAA